MVEDTKVDVGHHPTLVMSGISKSYAGVAALTDVSLDVVAGEIHALLGENGAGKSTLMGVASGATQADAGTITFAGESIASLDPGRRHRSGHRHRAPAPGDPPRHDGRGEHPGSDTAKRAARGRG